MDKYHGAILSDINDNLPREISDAFEYVAVEALRRVTDEEDK